MAWREESRTLALRVQEKWTGKKRGIAILSYAERKRSANERRKRGGTRDPPYRYPGEGRRGPGGPSLPGIKGGEDPVLLRGVTEVLFHVGAAFQE